jgi:predicted phosphodiesterase
LEFVTKKRIAILADIHGNSIALENVLKDIEVSGGVNEYWLLGDYAAIGPDPIGVLECLASLNNAWFIRGNTDRYLVEDGQPWPQLSDGEQDPELLSLAFRVARSFAWTTGAVGASGWLPWLADLPLEMSFTLPDGTRVLAVHASPGTDDGFGIHPNLAYDGLREHVNGVSADLLLVGHTHAPFDRTIDRMRVVNPGSISNPLPPDLRASYAILMVDRTGYHIELKRVEFDKDAVTAAAKKVNHPAAEYIAQFMRGERKTDWMK